MVVLSPPSKGRRYFCSVDPREERIPPTVSLTDSEGALEKPCFGHLISLLVIVLDG